jgi:hypothetical protein
MKNAPKSDHVPILRISESCLIVKKNFEDMMKLGIWRWENYPILSRFLDIITCDGVSRD